MLAPVRARVAAEREATRARTEATRSSAFSRWFAGRTQPDRACPCICEPRLRLSVRFPDCDGCDGAPRRNKAHLANAFVSASAIPHGGGCPGACRLRKPRSGSTTPWRRRRTWPAGSNFIRARASRIRRAKLPSLSSPSLRSCPFSSSMNRQPRSTRGIAPSLSILSGRRSAIGAAIIAIVHDDEARAAIADAVLDVAQFSAAASLTEGQIRV